MPTIITRAQWGARPAKGRTTVDDRNRKEFMQHYSTGEELGNKDSYAWVRSIQKFHQDGRGWDDIGYNFLVDADGRIFEGRGWTVVGAHCPDHNTIGYGVCFLGDDDKSYEDATQAARASIRWLYDQACARSGKKLTMLGHRDGKSTLCPGDELYAWVHAGMPLDGTVPVKPPVNPDNTTSTKAPLFPLPVGWYFGPKTGPKESVSGYYSHREDLKRWQTRMKARGWKITADGLYGPETKGVATAFQKEKGLKVDGLIGKQTWTAAWTAKIT